MTTVARPPFAVSTYVHSMDIMDYNGISIMSVCESPQVLGQCGAHEYTRY